MSLGTYGFGFEDGRKAGRAELARELFAPEGDQAPWCCVTFAEGTSGFASGIVHNEWGHDGPCGRDWGHAARCSREYGHGGLCDGYGEVAVGPV